MLSTKMFSNIFSYLDIVEFDHLYRTVSRGVVLAKDLGHEIALFCESRREAFNNSNQ